MKIPRYEYNHSNNHLNYSFESNGINGFIKKAIVFEIQNVDGITYFNLAFGDWNEKNNEIDDSAISNNKDTEKVLATIAAAVIDFTNTYPDMLVYAQGNTPAKNRLYQMGINANLEEISELFHIFGFQNDNWAPFNKNNNYEAFFVLRKKR